MKEWGVLSGKIDVWSGFAFAMATVECYCKNKWF